MEQESDTNHNAATAAAGITTSPTGQAMEESVSSSRRDATEDRQDQERGSLRRRSRTSRMSTIRSVAPITTGGQGTQFNLAGPSDSQQLRGAHEPFVHPGYGDLNPSYEQPNNAKPIWSLAKPLPRVVRPGMVPTKNELLESCINAELPAENSQKLGLDVDPNEIEKGRIDKSADVRKMAAQVTDARVQRENNFIKTLLASDAESTSGELPQLVKTRSSQRRPTLRRPSIQSPLYTVQEGMSEHESTHSKQSKQGHESQRLEQGEGEIDLGPDEFIEGNRSLETLRLDQEAYPEDLHPLVQNLVEDEIHNNHTVWSVVRTHHREALAESLAVFIQLTIGFCADLAVTVANAGNPNTTDWAWGFATMIGIYISGGVSGAHLNPTITIMLWFYRGFPKRKMPEYFLAQFLGAFCACLAAYGVYYVSIQHYLLTGTGTDEDIMNCFVTNQRSPYINAPTALFNEFVGTMCLTVVVLALGDDQNAPPGAGMNSLIIGLVITCLSMGFANQTGAALNPSRDFGPRLALLALGFTSELFTNPYWFYGPWAGTLLGSFMGAFLYDFMIFTGGESPVNYPLDRTQRALHKSRMKWQRRLWLTSKEGEDKIV
ncbi:mip transporter [Trichoderma arundinaceum]|uniref:Mip transporter n=1 Tax=Trichoderma arundinaceum TaxID=490622 RepID=A0A395NN34_TRIAR|nr:mip transporter [Trichoderma arundinaceum]